MFQMASVREQVSWVTADEDEATRKAKTLAAAAINRVSYHHELQTRAVAVHPDTLVVGGGIAGMQAALDIGNSDHKVYLVEKSTTIGGHMLQFDKTFPTLDCAACIGTPKMVEVAQNSNIELLSYSEVKDVAGYIGNYTVKIQRQPRYIKEGICTGCGECVNVCPVSVPSEWDEGLGPRKAIYRSFPHPFPSLFVSIKRTGHPVWSRVRQASMSRDIYSLSAKENIKRRFNLLWSDSPCRAYWGGFAPTLVKANAADQRLMRRWPSGI
jgi:heterodisulfide reductase subunit A